MAWKKGQSGNPNGRPSGSRDKYTNAFWVDLEDVWRRGGKGAMEKVLADDPATFLRVAASLIPKELEVTRRNAVTDMTDEEILARIAELRGTGASGDVPAAPLDPSQLN